MNTRRLKELHDYPWFPATWRKGMTDFLAFFATFLMQYDPAFPMILKIIQQSGLKRVRDFCSGGASYLLKLDRYLNVENDLHVNLIMTDKYPDIKTFKRLAERSGGTLSYSAEPADALAPPPEKQEFRVMFSAMHHFSLPELELMIEQAVADDCGVGFFDYAMHNHFRTLLLLPGVVPLVWILTPFMLPFSWKRLLWTYILPAIPVMLLIDGFISRWNGYKPEDFKLIMEKFKKQGCYCECGVLSNCFYIGETLYLTIYKLQKKV